MADDWPIISQKPRYVLNSYQKLFCHLNSKIEEFMQNQTPPPIKNGGGVFLLNQRVSLQIPPLSNFLEKKKGEGLSDRKFFVKVFLSKKISGASSRKKERGGGLSGRGGGIWSKTLWCRFLQIWFNM